MIAVIASADGSGRLELVERPSPTPAAGEVVLDVAASAVNRADLLQAAGRYPPPPGATDVLGLEASGVVRELGPGIAGWVHGERAMALLPGGGYAEHVSVPADHLMRVPDAMDLAEAAAVPEAYLTAWRALTQLAPLAAGEWVLIHAAASGVGTAAIQIARELDARPIGTVRSPAKLPLVTELGASGVLADPHFAEETARITEGAGVDVVVDLVGGGYWPETIATLAERGRVAMVGLLGGSRVELDLGTLMRLQARVSGGTLRSRSDLEKAALVAGFSDWGLPRLADGRLRPVVAETLPIRAAQNAHELIASNTPAGKVVLTIDR